MNIFKKKQILRKKKEISRHEINLAVFGLLVNPRYTYDFTIKIENSIKPIDYNITHNKTLKHYYILIITNNSVMELETVNKITN